jgi:Avidin family
MTSFIGKWVNELASEMEITKSVISPTDGTELIEGTYHTHVGTPRAKGPHALTGVVKTSLIGFSVSFGSAESICCWVGRLGKDAEGRECISTLWQLVSAHTFQTAADGSVSKVPADLWEAFHVQADIFYRKP